MITAVGIVVPARDERRMIRPCVRALLAALRQLPSAIESALCVLADRCTDDTANVAHDALGGWPAGWVVANRRHRTIGEVRDLGLHHVRDRLAHHPAATIWLLSTDADTTVATDWVTEHLRLARHGIHGVAGPAELADRSTLPEGLALRYRTVLAHAQGPHGHGNVYAANLGVRADAYQAVGGFGAVRTGEDHDLWRRLGRAGYRRCYATTPTVSTSARRHGRAPGGLADLLAALDRDEPAGPAPPRV